MTLSITDTSPKDRPLTIHTSHADALDHWRMLRETWQQHINVGSRTMPYDMRMALICALSTADRLIWQLEHDAQEVV